MFLICPKLGFPQSTSYTPEIVSGNPVDIKFKSELGLECGKESDLLMEKGVADANGCKMKLSSKKAEDPINVEEDDSEVSLLLPSQKGRRRKVQWNDNNGNKLAEILEFEPSEKSDSDDEDSDVCICTII